MKNWFKRLLQSFETGADISPEKTYREKYGYFQYLLSAQKKALRMMASPHPLQPRDIYEEVGRVVNGLNLIASQRYLDLFKVYEEMGGEDRAFNGGNPGGPLASNLPTPWPLQPRECRTLRDILTSAQDLAVEEMFNLQDNYDTRKVRAKRVKTGLPINLHVIDLGGGIDSQADDKFIEREQILSVPMRAMFKGMYYPGITWSGPIGINLKGLMVIMAQSSSRPEEDFWDKTSALVAREYMNYNSRLGYHYATVDAYCGDEASDNHIRFLFKGGAADDARRARRARFVGTVLERIGLAVEVKKDSVNASLRRCDRSATEEKLDLLGRLMGCSRQRDMVMNNESIVNWHVEAFLKGNYSFAPDP